MQKKVIRLADCRKQYTYDQDKACTPQETIDRFMLRLQEVNLDILKEVRRIDSGRLDIPVYFSMCGKDALHTIGNKKQMGKGSTPVQSRASACMELGERFSFFSFIQKSRQLRDRRLRAMEQAGYPVLDIDFLLTSVHDTTHSRDLLARLLRGLPMQWTWATNLTRGKEVMVPFSWFFAINEFNGPSAGNTPEEGILQGVCEIVERHVCAVITRDRLRPRALTRRRSRTRWPASCWINSSAAESRSISMIFPWIPASPPWAPCAGTPPPSRRRARSSTPPAPPRIQTRP